MTNWVICIEVRYFFHCGSAFVRTRIWTTYPDLGPSGGSEVVVV
jgi:hypothetical protein